MVKDSFFSVVQSHNVTTFKVFFTWLWNFCILYTPLQFNSTIHKKRTYFQPNSTWGVKLSRSLWPLQVFVGKIPRDLYEDELVPLFEKAGPIWDLRLMMDPLSGQNRGYAFITFCNKDAAQEAVKLVRHAIKTSSCMDRMDHQLRVPPIIDTAQYKCLLTLKQAQLLHINRVPKSVDHHYFYKWDIEAALTITQQSKSLLMIFK